MKSGTTCVALLTPFLLAHMGSIAQSISGVVNTYYSVTAVSTATNSVTVSNATGLEPGDLVLLAQMKGATINATNTTSYGSISAIGSAGAYEFNTICNVSAGQVWLKSPFVNTYDPTSDLQLVVVPSYQSVSISDTLTAQAWDTTSGTGGILAIAATDTIYLNAAIDVRGQGFIGGQLVNYPTPAYNCLATDFDSAYYFNFPASGDYNGGKKGEGITPYILNEEYGRGRLANGGGGGNNANSGGAGGGSYGAGGIGGKRAGESIFNCHGQYPGVGGLGMSVYGYSKTTNRIFLGGGGGSGHENNGVGEPGGNGGGIIILSAPVIFGGGGTLIADGMYLTNPACIDPTQAEGDGGGGGGGGGTIILDATTITGAITAEANGAAGSNSSNNRTNDCTGPGGGGGGGVIWTAGTTVPASLTTSVSGGANGIVSLDNTKTSCQGSSDGAMPGGTGTVQAGYVAPQSTGSVCVVLASPVIANFNGILLTQGAELSWNLAGATQPQDILSFILQRSTDNMHFAPVGTVAASLDSATYHDIDSVSFSGTVFYRLLCRTRAGNNIYTSVIALTRRGEDPLVFLRFHPNPTSSLLSVELYSLVEEGGTISIFNTLGQRLLTRVMTLHPGATTLNLSLDNLAPSVYFIVAESPSHHQISSFVKKD